MTEEQPVITIDDNPYMKNQLNDNQLGLVNKLAQLQQNKNNLLNQMSDIDILASAYLEQLKQSLKEDKTEE
jgi:hypothetical protein